MSLLEEYQKVENNFGLIALDDAVLRFEGKDLFKFLQGILSNDIQLLQKNSEIPACFLTAKGKWIAALHLFRKGDSIFAKTSPPEAQNLLQAIQALILFSESQVMDLSQDYQWILGIGKNANSWRDENALDQAFEHKGFRFPAFLILLPCPEVKDWLSHWSEFQISPETLEILRIESKIPRYGKDADDKTIPLEAGLDSYFSYTKGCYVGQETISRIKHYGKVNKKLMKIKFENRRDEPAGLPRKTQDLPLPCPVLFQNKEVGQVTSICHSPHVGNLALAYLPSEAQAPDTEVWIEGKEEKIKAQVIE